MKKGLRQGRLCSCGCGKAVKENYAPDGRFKGYYKYSPDCNPYAWKEERRQAHAKRISGLGHPSARPLGTRRKVRVAGGLEYWQVKTAETGRWKYEHRAVMEQLLGRPLLRSEHVHHVNEDSLDNRPENLQLLTHSDHSRLTSKQHGFGSWDRTKPHRCPCCGLFHSPAEAQHAV